MPKQLLASVNRQIVGVLKLKVPIVMCKNKQLDVINKIQRRLSIALPLYAKLIIDEQ